MGRTTCEDDAQKRIGRQLSAEDWFEFFFGDLTATGPSLLPDYRNRFALPRTLAALSLLRLVPSSDRPVLDLACGFGPFGHYLTQRRNPVAVVGVDFNFYLVWGQKNWIAPSGTFVCADASRRLPFVDDAFSAVLCSDAFIYFRDKPQVLAELNRCAPGKPMILTRVGNKTASPKEADALDPEGYMDLLASGGPRAFSEYALVRQYLARRNPLASEPTDVGDLYWDKWLTFVLNGRSLQDTEIDLKDEWPHEVGELAFNPIFERETSSERKATALLSVSHDLVRLPEWRHVWLSRRPVRMQSGCRAPRTGKPSRRGDKRPHRAVHPDWPARAIPQDATRDPYRDDSALVSAQGDGSFGSSSATGTGPFGLTVATAVSSARAAVTGTVGPKTLSRRRARLAWVGRSEPSPARGRAARAVISGLLIRRRRIASRSGPLSQQR